MISFQTLTPTGKVLDRFSDVIEIQSMRKINDFGFISLVVSAYHPALSSLQYLNRLYLYRSNPAYGLDWYLENYGIILFQQWYYDYGKIPFYIVIALHPNWLLSTRIVNWKAGTPGYSYFSAVPAETIAKSLVSTNCLAGMADASAGRERDGGAFLAPLTVQTDSASGNVLNWYCSFQNLLVTLRRLAAVGGGDFDLIPVGEGYEFQWFPGQRGFDLSPSVIFSLERGNMSSPVYTIDHRDEKTVCSVGGLGSGILRIVDHAYSSVYSPANDIESFTQAYNAHSIGAMQTAGANYLARHTANPQLTFDLLQLPSTYYGKHYALGDLVTVRNPFTNTDYVSKIVSVDLHLRPVSPSSSSPRAEEISIGIDYDVTDLPDDIPEAVQDYITIDNLENPILDADTFDDLSDPIFTIDGGSFTMPFLSEGISGGSFAL